MEREWDESPFENKPMLRNDPNYYNKLCEAMPPDMAEIYVYGKVGYVRKEKGGE